MNPNPAQLPPPSDDRTWPIVLLLLVSLLTSSCQSASDTTSSRLGAQRREWDSNPRGGTTPYGISSAAH